MDGWLTGKFEYAIDSKGRISIPAKFRDLFKENTRFHTIRVPKYRIRIYPEDEWEKKAHAYQNLPETELFDEYRREFYENQADSDMDAQGRITICPTQLKQINYGGGKIIMLGMGKYIEACCAESEEMQSGSGYGEAAEAAEAEFSQKYYAINEAMREFEK